MHGGRPAHDDSTLAHRKIVLTALSDLPCAVVATDAEAPRFSTTTLCSVAASETSIPTCSLPFGWPPARHSGPVANG